MRRGHFDALRPICPVCRPSAGVYPLAITAVEREEPGHIVEGVIGCTNAGCQREYPIIDGIPLLMPAIRSYFQDQQLALLRRDDLGSVSESMVGDCLGPGTPFDALRQHLSSYVWDHYAGFDPAELGEARPGSIARLLDAAVTDMRVTPGQPVLDVGCGAGRTAFELAQRSGGLVLGVDLHFGMLRVAARALRSGVVRYPRRRVGLVYDRREFPVAFPASEQVDFWACDALALPFADGQWPLAVSLNMLDCVSSPAAFVSELRRVLASAGQAVLTCPYDWFPSATAVEGWLGGHSQRSATAGASEPAVRQLLAQCGLEVTGERGSLDWQVRLHERAVIDYKVHSVIARVPPPAGEAP